MALRVERTSEQLVVRRLSALSWGAGLALAAAFLIPAAFERLEKQPNRATVSTGLKRAAVILFITSGLAPWTRVTIDRRRRSVHWRRSRFLGLRVSGAGGENISRVEQIRRPDLRFVARHVVRLHGEQAPIAISLGWSWGAESRKRIEQIAGEMERALAPCETIAAPESPPPRPRFQLSLRRLLLATFGGAAALGFTGRLAPHPDANLLPGVAALATMVFAGCMLFRWGEPAIERMLLLLIVTYGPFAWIAEVAWPWGHGSGMWKLFLFFPSSVVFSLLFRTRVPHEFETWIAAAITLLEFGLLSACAIRGWKWPLPAAVVVGLISCVLSFGAYAAYRM